MTILVTNVNVDHTFENKFQSISKICRSKSNMNPRIRTHVFNER